MTDLRLYDTMSRQKARFEPIDPQNVRMYVCGPTVYDRAHIGNGRAAVVFDQLFRVLRHRYGAEHVRYVRNITDVEDKIIVRAQEIRGEGESLNAAIGKITAETTVWYHEDMAALGALRPTVEPRATDHIDGMIAMIEGLIDRGVAYAAEGHALFSVSSYDGYGALSRRSVEDMLAGARVEVAPYKRDPMDFVLWKPSSDEEPGWDSPWGRGRPGWHIECSAMSKAILGETFDIHGGGVDLVFPHHENERAQSLCAHPHGEFARFWMHNGFLQVNGEKMSKSLGNFFTVHDLLNGQMNGEAVEPIPGEVIRLALLTTHYRQPIDWTEKLAEEARKALVRWRAATDGVDAADTVPEAVIAALYDDLNTPKAIAEMHALAREGRGPELKAAGAVMGLLTPELGGWEAVPEIDAALAGRIETLLDRRAAARKAKDFALSDRIRDGLAAAGVEVKDRPGGAEWSLARDFDADKLAALDE